MEVARACGVNSTLNTREGEFIMTLMIVSDVIGHDNIWFTLTRLVAGNPRGRDVIVSTLIALSLVIFSLQDIIHILLRSSCQLHQCLNPDYNIAHFSTF